MNLLAVDVAVISNEQMYHNIKHLSRALRFSGGVSAVGSSLFSISLLCPPRRVTSVYSLAQPDNTNQKTTFTGDFLIDPDTNLLHSPHRGQSDTQCRDGGWLHGGVVIWRSRVKRSLLFTLPL
jgi:hypothetical protein